MEQFLSEIVKMLAKNRVPCERIGLLFSDEHLGKVEARVYARNSTYVAQCKTISLVDIDAAELKQWLQNNCVLHERNSYSWFL